VRSTGARGETREDRTAEEIGIDELLQTVDHSVAETLAGKSLKTLIIEYGLRAP
jgi:hypothetical protein